MRVRTNGTDGGATWLGRVALAAGALIAVAGCTVHAGYGPPLSPENYKRGNKITEPYTFTITPDAQGCPAKASMEPEWRKCPGQVEDCVRVLRGESVRFQSKDNLFVLQFDPFGKTTIDAGGNPVVLPTLRNPKAAKPYTFIIRGTGKGCGDSVVDPQIILD